MFSKQNVFLETVNQVPDTSLEEISNANLNTATVAMNNYGGGDADLTKDRSSGPSKTTNETSKMIETAKDDSEMADLSDEKNTTEETETKRDRLSCSCLLYTSPSPRDLSTSRMPSSA